MRAVYVDNYGGNAAIRLGELPEPKVGDHDVLVEVHASSVNPIDFHTRSGTFKPIKKYKFPLILGSDLSGLVCEVGAAVTRFQVGDAVFGRVSRHRIGTWAERIAVDAQDLAPKPPRLTHLEAATIPLVGLTTWQAIVERAQLREGQSILIHAGAGGVGTFAIQLAHHLGARVYTTASAGDHALLRSLGADVPIDYRTERFEDVAEELHVVYDTLGGETRRRSYQVLRPGGLLVTIYGMPDGASMAAWGAPPPLRWLATAIHHRERLNAWRHGVRYLHLGMRSDGAQLAQIGELLESGSLTARVGSTFDLGQIREALSLSESGRAKGKIAIQVATR